MKRGASVVLSTLAVLALAAAPAPAAETAHMERSFPAARIRMVQAKLSFHDLHVKVAPGDTIRVTVDLEAPSASRLKEIRPRVEVDGEVLQIVQPEHHHHFWGWGHTRATVTVVMPPGRELNADTASGDVRLDGDLETANLHVDTASGDVTVEGAFAGGELDTASGDVRLELTRPAAGLDVETASGDVTVDGGAARVKVETASGDVRVHGLTGPAQVDTASGDVTLEWASSPAGPEAEVETASGDVRVILPPAATVAGTVTTHSGDLSSDFPATRIGHGRALELRAEHPSLRMEISTASGSVSIEKAGS